MSIEYDLYLQQHKSNVARGFTWMRDNLPDIMRPIFRSGSDIEWLATFAHDASKTDMDEYAAYDAYFYGGNRSFQVVQNFRLAWLAHLHKNPHHWQYWVLINDDPNEGEIILDMPDEYVIEMICDWWSFCWASGDLMGIFDWYDQHKNYMKLSDKTRTSVETLLNLIKFKLAED